MLNSHKEKNTARKYAGQCALTKRNFTCTAHHRANLILSLWKNWELSRPQLGNSWIGEWSQHRGKQYRQELSSWIMQIDFVTLDIQTQFAKVLWRPLYIAYQSCGYKSVEALFITQTTLEHNKASENRQGKHPGSYYHASPSSAHTDVFTCIHYIMQSPPHLLTAVLKPLTVLLKETEDIWRRNTTLQNMDM